MTETIIAGQRIGKNVNKVGVDVSDGMIEVAVWHPEERAWYTSYLDAIGARKMAAALLEAANTLETSRKI